MELDAPALVRRVLCEHGLSDGVADGDLLPGIGAALAAQHTNGIRAFFQRAIIPAFDCGESEAHWLTGARVLPCACSQLLDRSAQLAKIRRRRQQLSNNGEAQVRPSFVHTLMSWLLRHAGAPRDLMGRP